MNKIYIIMFFIALNGIFAFNDIDKIKSVLKNTGTYHDNLVLPENIDEIYKKDKELFKRIITKYLDDYPENPTNYRLKFLLAYNYYNEKDYTEAVKYFEEIIGIYTEIQDYVLFYLGDSYQVLKENEKAYRAYSLIDKNSVFYERALIRKLNILFNLRRYSYIKILFENNRDLLENTKLNMIYVKTLINLNEKENAVMQLKKMWFQAIGKQRKNIEKLLRSFNLKSAKISGLEYYNRCEYLLQMNRYKEIERSFKLSYSLKSRLKLNTDICLIKAYLFDNKAEEEILTYIRGIKGRTGKDKILKYTTEFLDLYFFYVKKNFIYVIKKANYLLNNYKKYPYNEKIYEILINSYKRNDDLKNYYKTIKDYLKTDYQKNKLKYSEIMWKYFYFEKKDYKETVNWINAYLNFKNDDLRAENRAEYYRGKSYLKLKDYKNAVFYFIRMIIKDPFGYYSYTAFKSLKKIKSEISKDIIISAVKDVKSTVVKIDLEYFYKSVRIAKIYELFKLGLLKEAKTELLNFQKKASNETEFFAIALFFENLKFYKSARNVKFKFLRMIPFFPDKESFLSFWRSFYPKKYKKFVIKYSKEFKVDSFFAWAIIREESAYNPMALSSSNAYGLMQLLYPTAVETASRIGLTLNTPDELFLPENNIRLGIKYLSVLLKMFKGNKFYTAASYNGGASNVKKWIKTYNHREDIYDWSEEIPFEETNRYIYKVLSSYHAYKLLYDLRYFTIGKVRIIDEVFK